MFLILIASMLYIIFTACVIAPFLLGYEDKEEEELPLWGRIMLTMIWPVWLIPLGILNKIFPESNSEEDR